MSPPIKLRLLSLASLLLATSASAATLTVTPDKSTYQVGETITLDVFGDAEGAGDDSILGILLFDPTLATYVDSTQQLLTSFGGNFTWQGSEDNLLGGEGFATAFAQTALASPTPVDGPLVAQVVLLAVAPGTLDYEWKTSGQTSLSFFGLTDAPGGSVTIVPEPSTLLLVGVGLAATSLRRRFR